MVVSYTIAAPIWKTTYRVVLDQAGEPFFQGWAIVDNVSDEDWKNVQLSLVSGSPISFIQQLQKPFYRYRPVVPIPQDLQLQPQVYEPQSGNGQINTTINSRAVGDLPAGTSFSSLLKVAPNVKPEPLNGGFQVDGASGAENTYRADGQEVSNFSTGQLSTTTVSDALRSANAGITAAASGEEIGDLFEYRIEQPVTVNRDRSALIPIVQTTMEGERVAIYNESVRMDRPYSGVLLKNMTNLTLESGSLTVIDGNAYAGEALMERLKPKEQRLISFALDLGTHVRVRQTGDREPAKMVKAVNGILQVHYFRGEQKTYEISNQTERPKALYIEVPIRNGWELSDDSPKPEYTTQKYYRFRVELGPLAEKEFKISFRQPLMDTYQLTNLSKVDLALFVSRGYINDATRAMLDKLIDIRMQIGTIETKLDSFDDEVEKIEADQKRLRENIEALSKTAEAKTLITRYIAKANDQETQLEDMEKQRKALQAQKEKLSQDLATEIRNFEIK
jgi:flagellar capping protein FliD